MKNIISPFIIVLTAITLCASLNSCKGAKSYVKRGAKMEAAGMIDQAADFYSTALKKKPANLDALSGLNRTGQIILSRHLALFEEATLRSDKESAIRNFKNAESFYDKVNAFGVTLNFPDSKRAQYESVKNDHVQELYTIATSHLEKLEYNQALKLLEEITSLVPGFKDAASLADFAFCTPTYDLAMTAMDDKLFRSAYETFSDVVNRDETFKDASERRDEVLELGRFTIALMSFKNGSNRRNISTKLSSYVEQNLMESNDPFLVVVDRESIDLILQEQQLELSGLTSGAELEIGSLLGVKAILKGTVTGCTVSTTPLRHDNKRGYEKYRVETIDSEGKKRNETKYRSVGYSEFYQSSEVAMSFTLKLVSMETGAILSSKTIESYSSDDVRYLKYGGNARMLYPAKSNGSVNASSSGHNMLLGLIGQRENLKNDNIMVDDVTKNLAVKIQREIESIIQEQVR
jgi:tetratricopeptide (TPR) repeat protein